jgi:Spy/CpxP family protein refolding chaperone
MRFRSAALIAAAALALATLPAAAQGFGPPRHGMGRGDGNPVLHMAKELGLSDEQVTQVQAVAAKYRDQGLDEAMRAMREAQANVRKTVHDSAATDDQVRKASAVVAALASQVAVQHHQMAVEISSILTADQRTKLDELLADRRERRAGPHRGGPGGF